jgi:hypothetical protein
MYLGFLDSEEMRTEVKEFMKQCERLFALATRSKELSEDECEIISYYAEELRDKAASLHPRNLEGRRSV